MSANLPGEFAKFAKNSKYLRRIWRDTKASLDDIAKCGYFSEGELRGASSAAVVAVCFAADARVFASVLLPTLLR